MTVRHHLMRLTLIAVCASALAACGRSGAGSPTSPSGPGPRSGTWQGTLTDAGSTTGTLRLTLDERALDGTRSLLSGTWVATFEDPSRNGAGTLSGTITGTTASLLLTPASPPACAGGPFAIVIGSYSAPQLTIAGRSIRGLYSQATCAGSLTGTLALLQP